MIVQELPTFLSFLGAIAYFQATYGFFFWCQSFWVTAVTSAPFARFRSEPLRRHFIAAFLGWAAAPLLRIILIGFYVHHRLVWICRWLGRRLIQIDIFTFTVAIWEFACIRHCCLFSNRVALWDANAAWRSAMAAAIITPKGWFCFVMMPLSFDEFGKEWNSLPHLCGMKANFLMSFGLILLGNWL